MDLLDQLRKLSNNVENSKSLVQTEEATKTAMVMPFIAALGYNVFDPTEVTPELTADVGTKKGEKVDYAILKDGKPIIIFECKSCTTTLNINHASQLFRYFHVTEARFGVLTNGMVYKFFTDLDQPNKMDDKPFLEFNILDFKDPEIDALKKFTKSSFDVDNILVAANDLKYIMAIRNSIIELMNNPSDDFVKLVSNDLIQGKRFTPVLKEQFANLTKLAFQQVISRKINETLHNAMRPDSELISSVVEQANTHQEEIDSVSDTRIITTPEELEGYYIIKSILRDTVSPKRVFMRDAQSYCAILLDDNNRKPLCRLRFNNTSRLAIGLFNGKDEEKIQIADVDDIHNYADRLKQTAVSYNIE